MDPRTAAHAIEAALRQSPNNPNILYQYGIQLARMGDKARLDEILAQLAKVSKPEWPQVRALNDIRKTM
jgi:cytochrome c-type biogenesis protein CcmH/NrfG